YLTARPTENPSVSVSPGTMTHASAKGKPDPAQIADAESSERAASTDSRNLRGGLKKLRFSYKEQKEFEVIDEEIAALEEKLASLEDDMNRFASDYGKLNTIVREKGETEQQLEAKMERWVYLNDLKERIDAQTQ
ncbi:MAG: ABC transporter ATP-binding protein, partial [Lachnospiraceae bacterium]|nr:ABC transporter ATP-binding protein [Lachnospiraceae bacterium]